MGRYTIFIDKKIQYQKAGNSPKLIIKSMLFKKKFPWGLGSGQVDPIVNMEGIFEKE